MSHDFPAVGAFYNGYQSLFTVWAPQARKVDLILEDRIYPMTILDGQYWTTAVDNVGPDAAYRFRLDDQQQLPDPASRWQPDGVHGASRIVN